MILLNKVQPEEDGVPGVSCHGVVRCEIGPDADALLIHVWSWTSDAARLAGRDPARRGLLRVPLSCLVVSSSVLDEALAVGVPGSWLDGALRVPDAAGDDLALARARKRVQINAAWAAADVGFFVFLGSAVRCDAASRARIAAINGTVALTGAFPPGWPGGWRAEDNTLLPLPDRAAWEAFHAAMVAQGLANFAQAQRLKAEVDAAETLGAVDAIKWVNALA